MLVGAAWNAVNGDSFQRQAPGWQRQRGRDIRAQPVEAVLRLGFAACMPAGAYALAQRTKKASTTLLANACVVAEAMQRGLRGLVDGAVDKLRDACHRERLVNPNYKHSYASVSIMSDIAQQTAYLPKDKRMFARGETATRPAGPAVVGLLVQVVSLFLPAAGVCSVVDPVRSDWIIPPFVIQDESVSNTSVDQAF